MLILTRSRKAREKYDDATANKMPYTYSAAFFSAIFSSPFWIAIFLVIAMKIVLSTDWYKKTFAQQETTFAKLTGGIFAPLKQKIFADLSKRLKEVNGDVLEIGIGAGENLMYYPQGTSIIAVDPNPHVEKLLRENLETAVGRVHLKKFVTASAEDLSCKPGKFGVEDNSVAAVVCTLVLCSMTDDQTRKTLQEVKRVLKPGGRFYFIEHVAGKPWTLQYFGQHVLTKSGIFPTVCNGCCCNKETQSMLEEAGFKTVQAEKIWLNWAPEPGFDAFVVCTTRLCFPFIRSMIFGFVEKE